MSSRLEDFFNNRAHRFIHKWIHYFEIYERHFKDLVGKGPINILEIGIFKGGSIEMWIDYFGKDNCFIYAIDIDPRCKEIEKSYDNVKVFIGDQADKQFLASVCDQIPPVDILIDDGGHTMIQQINTFEVLYDHVKGGGIYLCEDLHTSYWANYGGGHKRKDSFIEYIKDYIDKLNAHHSREDSLTIDKYTDTIHSMHFYDSIVVLEKFETIKPPLASVLRGSYGIDNTLNF